MRKRKLLRGNEITGDMVQLNAKVTGYGEKTLDELVPKKEKKENVRCARRFEARSHEEISPGSFRTRLCSFLTSDSSIF